MRKLLQELQPPTNLTLTSPMPQTSTLSTIPNIYNYCDRWCERCPFAQRCEVRLHELKEQQATIDDTNDFDIEAILTEITTPQESKKTTSKEELMNSLNEALSEMADLLKDLLTQNGFKVGEIKTEKKINTHQALEKLAREYYQLSDKWFNSNLESIREHGEDLMQQLDMELPINTEQLEELNEAIETIFWYQHFIGAKIHRAIGSLELINDPFFDPIQNDAIGSAKVAIIAIQKSQTAWRIVLAAFPEKTDSLIDVLLCLQQLNEGVLATFPDAPLFVRPGFDD